MNPINIYALTRIEDRSSIAKYERQMSRRNSFLKVKDWEIEGVRKLSDSLVKAGLGVEKMLFYYSYQLPKLGKEFDLLRINEDKIINIELKSVDVPDDKIKKQLVQNRYYLNTLGRNVRSYTYISSTGRLVRLTNSERLIEADWDMLRDDINLQTDCTIKNIEDIISEDSYIISPFAEPDRFLNKEYFLTSQQKDIAYHILRVISDNSYSLQGFTGAPGTGKTLLLYDLAMTLTDKQCAAVFHCGSFPEELKKLESRLKRIDIYDGTIYRDLPEMEKYNAILVDEAHGADGRTIRLIVDYARRKGLPVIFSYDCEEAIAPEERSREGIEYIESLDEYVKYRLTNRIRTNAELSSFIHCLLHVDVNNHRHDYPNVNVYYANNEKEKTCLIDMITQSGYVYIYEEKESKFDPSVHITNAVSREYDKVVMVLDKDFYYCNNYLRNSNLQIGGHVVNTFHGLSRGKKAIALVIWDNRELFNTVISVLQGFRTIKC